MTVLLALVLALTGFGTLNVTTLHAHAHPACGSLINPDGGCNPGPLHNRSSERHVRVASACSGTTEPNGGCAV
jgi:hypothetical protein